MEDQIRVSRSLGQKASPESSLCWRIGENCCLIVESNCTVLCCLGILASIRVIYAKMFIAFALSIVPSPYPSSPQSPPIDTVEPQPPTSSFEPLPPLHSPVVSLSSTHHVSPKPPSSVLRTDPLVPILLLLGLPALLAPRIVPPVSRQDLSSRLGGHRGFATLGRVVCG